MRTRLVCTLAVPRAGGTRPQDREDYVAGLVAAGMDVARINLSHATAAADFAAGRAPRYDAELELIRRVRNAAAAEGPARHVAVMLDVQGTKTRFRLPDAAREATLSLAAGEELRVRVSRDRVPGEVTCDGSPALLAGVTAAVARGGRVAVAVGDGDPFLSCERVEGDVVVLRAPEACVLGNGKGVTFRGIEIDGEPPLTPKDLVDIAAFALPAILAGDADAIALSFVQSARDVERLRSYVAAAHAWFRRGERPADAGDAAVLERLLALRPDLPALCDADLPPFLVVAKIETARGAAAVEEILGVAGGVMVARGDLGLHEAPEDVPRHQKSIVRAARRLGRPVIVATQMLESMLTAPEPRRSEATDVFNAVLDGADAVMLSGETATGARPHLAAATLARIARAAERWEDDEAADRPARIEKIGREIGLRRAPGDHVAAATDLVTLEAVRAAEALGVEAIVAASRTGGSARNLARFDPLVPVVAIVPDGATARSLAFTGSVRAVVTPAQNGDEALERGLAAAVAAGLLRRGARVVVASARTDDPPGATTCLSVRTVLSN